MNKKKLLMERNLGIEDGASINDGSKYGANARRTEIIFKDPVTGEEFLRVENKVVISGAQFTACKHFDLAPVVDLPSYNKSLGLDQSVYGQTPINVPKICLFGCGIDGCGTENSQVYPVDYGGRIKPNSLIPFRYQLTNNDISSELRKSYFGRKVANGRIAYYFKAFDSVPTLHMRYIDGTPIDSNLYDSTNPKEKETYVEILLKITKQDFREYFTVTTGIESAKINNISLMSGWYKEADGFKWYQDIIPITQLNIPNEPLIDPTKGIDIIYHIYY